MVAGKWKWERDPGAEANRLIVRLEDQFDLMRVRGYRSELERREDSLAEEVEVIRDGLKPPERGGAVPGKSRVSRLRETLVARARIMWLGLRRESLVEKQRWYLSLEDDIRFSMRLRR